MKLPFGCLFPVYITNSFFQNLDVNLAVNNLLSRDDDEGDDADDASDPYMSDDLMSLLDAGIAHAGETGKFL